MDDRDFRQYFDAFGSIVDCQIMLDHNTQRSRGFGFVTYDSPGPVDDIMQRRDHSIKGKEVRPGRGNVWFMSHIEVLPRAGHTRRGELTPEATPGGVGWQVEIKRAFPRGADVNRQSLAPPPGRGGPMSRGGGGYDRGGYDRLIFVQVNVAPSARRARPTVARVAFELCPSSSFHLRLYRRRSLVCLAQRARWWRGYGQGW